MEITEQLVTKLLQTVDAGLVGGIGEPIPGKMCIEAAVCYAMGLPHSDKPTCVGEAVRKFKIYLNDAKWSSEAARAAGLRKLGVAQLGSSSIDQADFARIVSRETIHQILPIVLRNAAKINYKHAESLEKAAKLCKAKPTAKSAEKAYVVVVAACDPCFPSNPYANSAYLAFHAAEHADYACASGAVISAIFASATAAVADRDAILNISAKIALEALIKLKSPGCQWLHLCDL